MNKLILFFASFFCFSFQVFSQFTLTVNDPDRRTYGHKGYITDATFEVTPQGAYANIDMIFTINAQSTSSTQLEAVMQFNLPKGAFIHDSWLWLNDTVIIRADVVEKNRAVQIYEGIVNRRRDPSLLVKLSDTKYQLNVYPMTINYPRKVKLSYSVPAKWYNDQMKVDLPIGILRSSTTMPDMALKVNQNPLYNNPSFLVQNYSAYLKGNNGPQDSLYIPASDMKYEDFVLKFKSSIGNNVILTQYPTSANSGIYQLVLPPDAIGSQGSRNLSIIIDMDDNNLMTHSLADIKYYLRNELLKNYSSLDSFNLFYVYNNSVVRAFNSWQAISYTNVHNAIAAMPVSFTKNASLYKDLIKQGLQFCATKSKNEAEVLLISQNYDYSASQTQVDAMFKDIETSIGGYKNKINVFNCSRYRTWTGGTSVYANAIWYSKLTLATGGVMYDYYQQYTADVPDAIGEIAANGGEHTSAYSLTVQMNNGFTHSEYTVGNSKRLNYFNNNIIIGRYSGGNMSNGTVVDLQAIFPSQNVNKQFAINNVLTGSNNSVKEWSYLYIEDLISQNNKSLIQEIIDSSINNRVLCTYTAFLAVETGDTITTNADNNPGWLTVEENVSNKQPVLKAYPNPFVSNLTLELPDGAQYIDVYDITGKKILHQELLSGTKKYVWKGMSASGEELPSGTYIVVVKTEKEQFTLKVMKR